MSARPATAWTPQRLADALRHTAYPLSRSTIARCCARNEIPHTRTAGGHVRIDPAYVARVWPGIAAAT